MIGHLCTTWVGATGIAKELLAPPDERQRTGHTAHAAAAFRACMAKLSKP